jgi:hypothetical protein
MREYVEYPAELENMLKDIIKKTHSPDVVKNLIQIEEEWKKL